MEEYTGTDGEIGAISFQILAATGKLTIRLPADKERALEALWLDYADGAKLNAKGDAIEEYGNRKKLRKQDFAKQADRTAWKIVQDWVEVQMSMIQLKQAETLQVFLPYVYNGKKTFYQSLKETNFRGLIPEKAGDDA